MDPATIAVGDYDEEPDESFIGPSFLEEEYYDNEGYDEDDYYDEQSAAQRDDPSNADLVSQHTHPRTHRRPCTPDAGVRIARPRGLDQEC